MLIAIMVWKKPKYVFFATRPKPNHGERDISLGAMSDIRNKQMNASIFKGYLRNLQEAISSLWRITLQVVTYYRVISNFKATRHEMWIHAWKDPNK
jgi:hypothetical protein